MGLKFQQFCEERALQNHIYLVFHQMELHWSIFPIMHGERLAKMSCWWNRRNLRRAKKYWAIVILECTVIFWRKLLCHCRTHLRVIIALDTRCLRSKLGQQSLCNRSSGQARRWHRKQVREWQNVKSENDKYHTDLSSFLYSDTGIYFMELSCEPE